MLPVQSAEMLLQVASGRRRNAMVGWTVLFLSVLTGGAMLIFFRNVIGRFRKDRDIVYTSAGSAAGPSFFGEEKKGLDKNKIC